MKTFPSNQTHESYFNDVIDERLLWSQCFNSASDCEVCVGFGEGGANALCKSHFINAGISLQCDKRLSFHTFNSSQDIQEQECGFNSKCCIRKKKYSVPSTYKRCQVDVCKVHLTFITFLSKRINNFKQWQTHTDINAGRVVGGHICHLLFIYGVTISLPILLNFIFNVFVFCDDVKNKTSHPAEVILVILLVYPQWRVLKYLFRYVVYHKSETQLEEEKAAYERDVGSLEPFLESLWQVRTFHIQHTTAFLYTLFSCWYYNTTILIQKSLPLGTHFVCHHYNTTIVLPERSSGRTHTTL